LEDIEVLIREKVEETAKSNKADILKSEMLQTHPFSNTAEPSDPSIRWFPTDFALSPRLFADLEILDIVEIPLNIRSGF